MSDTGTRWRRQSWGSSWQRASSVRSKTEQAIAHRRRPSAPGAPAAITSQARSSAATPVIYIVACAPRRTGGVRHEGDVRLDRRDAFFDRVETPRIIMARMNKAELAR
jgi:hypothetical protein